MRSYKFPKFSQWKQIFKVLKKGEKRIFIILVILALGSFAELAIEFYINSTKLAPGFGGIYREGVVGQPRFINPIYGETNDVDRTLIDLIYSGLMTYDKDAKLIKDLVQDYQISEDGKTYSFQLKDNIYWQDGLPLTADDVVFTIKTIQNSDYKSPLRANWLDVDIEKTSDRAFNLLLKNPYNSFLEICTIKIIPQHIWQNILPESFALSSYNLQPVGSGPYALSGLKQASNGFIKSIELTANRKYYNKVGYISKISFSFFENKDELIKAANQKTIDGFSLEKEIKQGWSQSEKFSVYSFSLPRYFAVFFNTQKSKILSDSNITKALSYSVNKTELVEKIKAETKAKSFIVDSPILPNFFGYNLPAETYNFDQEAAKKLLDKSGYKDLSPTKNLVGDEGSGQRAKPNDKKAAFQFKNYLSVSSKGKDVAELQGCLARLDNSLNELLQGETSAAFGKRTEKAVSEFQKKYLPDIDPTGTVGSTTRKKLNELCLVKQDDFQLLKFTLFIINQPQMIKVANLLKDYWQKIGVTVEIKIEELSELKTTIKERSYDALLYGQALGTEPDLYPFWHSSQINDPGLNLTYYQDKNVDQLLKDARETLDQQAKKAKYEKLQDIIISDAPALFLYNTDYLYWVSQKVKGIETTKIIDPAKRFSDIENWYIQTRRVWK